jgi:hypothetical protein
MPYQERLTWDGVALHAGGLPGYPESHGCVHLPSQFAEDLFQTSHLGMTVVVVDEKSAPRDVAHPAVLAPVDPNTGADDVEARLEAGQEFRWEPERSPDGPVSILLSGADQRAIVLRNGIEIGRARLAIDDPGKPLGTCAFIVKAGAAPATSVVDTGQSWMAVSMAGYRGATASVTPQIAAGRLHLPAQFTSSLSPLLVPGTTLFVTDAPILDEDSGTKLTVLSSGNPNEPGTER